MKKVCVILLVVYSLLALSCSQRPSNVLSRDQMMDVLYDLQLAQAMTYDRDIELASTDEGKRAIMNSVLLKYGISQEDLDSSIMWYSDNMTEYKIVNDSVIARLETKVKVLREEDNALRGISTVRKDTIAPYFYLDKAVSKYSFSFSNLNDSIKKNFNLKFNVIGLNDKNNPLETKLYFVYRDTTIITQMLIQKDTMCIMNKPSLSDSLLNEIQGYFRLENANRSVPVKIYDIKYIDKRSAEEKELDTLMDIDKTSR